MRWIATSGLRAWFPQPVVRLSADRRTMTRPQTNIRRKGRRPGARPGASSFATRLSRPGTPPPKPHSEPAARSAEPFQVVHSVMRSGLRSALDPLSRGVCPVVAAEDPSGRVVWQGPGSSTVVAAGCRPSRSPTRRHRVLHGAAVGWAAAHGCSTSIAWSPPGRRQVAVVVAVVAGLMLVALAWQRRHIWLSRLSWPLFVWLARCRIGLASLVLISQPPGLWRVRTRKGRGAEDSMLSTCLLRRVCRRGGDRLAGESGPAVPRGSVDGVWLCARARPGVRADAQLQVQGPGLERPGHPLGPVLRLPV